MILHTLGPVHGTPRALDAQSFYEAIFRTLVLSPIDDNKHFVKSSFHYYIEQWTNGSNFSGKSVVCVLSRDQTVELEWLEVLGFKRIGDPDSSGNIAYNVNMHVFVSALNKELSKNTSDVGSVCNGMLTSFDKDVLIEISSNKWNLREYPGSTVWICNWVKTSDTQNTSASFVCAKESTTAMLVRYHSLYLKTDEFDKLLNQKRS
jgi:hypothetical protein